MNDNQIHERAIHKAESQISFIKLEMNALEQETPYMSYTTEMIEAQQAFKVKEIDTWRYMLDCVKIVETQRMIEKEQYDKGRLVTNVELLQSLADINAGTPNFETKFGKTTKYK
tara:strand:- start:86 stop:427 length:342 start_codon:yes stop_codon:yes gene_type:complete